MTYDRRQLWPEDLLEGELTAPSTILKTQANYLTKVSKGRLRGKVYTDWEPQPRAAAIEHLFRIEVPALGNYAFDLFTIKHNPHALYPAYIEFNLGDSEEEVFLTADTEEDLRETLAKIFRDSRTKSVIRTLQAQAGDPSIRPPEKAETRDSEDDIPF